MQNRNFKYFLIAGSTLISFFVFLGCASSNISGTENPTAVLPIRTLTVDTDPNQRSELGKHLNVFAKMHNLEVDTAFYTNKKFDGPFFYIMYGEDLEVSGFFTPDSRTTDIGFYEKSKGVPPQQEYLDGIYSDLKEFLSELPSIVILEER
jgi:hypothetical protein